MESRNDQIGGGLLRSTAAFEALFPQGTVLSQEPHQGEVWCVFGQPCNIVLDNLALRQAEVRDEFAEFVFEATHHDLVE